MIILWRYVNDVCMEIIENKKQAAIGDLFVISLKLRLIIIDVLLAVLPRPGFDDPNHLALRHEPPVTAIVGDAAVVTHDKVVTLRDFVVGD